jgi:hypothetical protein
MELFHASTTVVRVGDRKKANFSTHPGYMERPKKNIAPSLLKRSKRKNFTVHTALNNNYWITEFYHVQSREEIVEYLDLWEKIQTIDRDVNTACEITWCWTANGEYTTKNAYRIQFQGRLKSIDIGPILKAKTEPKCKIFVWILLHRKILTSNNLEKRGWPNDPLCQLCNTAPETPTHLCKDCPYTRQVWSELVT